VCANRETSEEVPATTPAFCWKESLDQDPPSEQETFWGIRRMGFARAKLDPEKYDLAAIYIGSHGQMVEHDPEVHRYRPVLEGVIRGCNDDSGEMHTLKTALGLYPVAVPKGQSLRQFLSSWTGVNTFELSNAPEDRVVWGNPPELVERARQLALSWQKQKP